ncbi:hypothetical protein DFH08DRAFT_830064 [Mycena albidolilacea]|uniref:Uncharacterized protein n=1 Tax=Mycena albidolilacea TaxID=1033008 RepID=A0AAD7ATW8_9AGAR|nr:hypothetical protein DFH08DRAFT_830064 [Mycena albidolilacea]
MDTPASEPPSPLPPPEPITPGADNVTVAAERGSAVRHLAILSTGLATIAFIPYLITRRQVSTLRRKVDEVGATTTLLKQRQGLGQVAPGAESGPTTAAILAQMRQEIEAMRAQLEQKDSERAESLSGITMDVIDVNEELDQVKSGLTHATDGISWLDSRLKPLEGLGNQTEVNLGEIHEQIRLLRAEQEALRTEVFKLSDEVQTAKTGPQASELQRLLLETKQTRAIFGSIGTSLGDLAHVIERVEIELGHERNGGYDPVERLRVLALQMQDESFEAGERQASNGRRGRR